MYVRALSWTHGPFKYMWRGGVLGNDLRCELLAELFDSGHPNQWVGLESLGLGC